MELKTAEFINNLTSDELIAWTKEAHSDLIKFSEEQPQSDSHADAFCALILLCEEMHKRGLTLNE